MSKLLIIISLLIITSCTPQRRLHRLLKHHPELITRDTLTIKDTVITEAIKADTVFISHNGIDTFYLVKDKLKIQIVKHFDTLKVSGECVGDTIYKTIQIPYDKIVYKKSFIDKYGNLLLILLLVVALFFIAKKLLK